MGRNKGNAAEREVARKLEAWWVKVEPEAKFVRTPLSGGWSTPQVRRDFRASGDIMTTAERFPFAVEVKRREGWSLATFVAGKRSPVWGWWREAQAEAAELRAEPMLWIRRNAERAKGSEKGGTLPPIWTVLLRRDYVRALDLPPPDLFWHVDTFDEGVDFGKAIPIGYIEHTLLGIAPSELAK